MIDDIAKIGNKEENIYNKIKKRKGYMESDKRNAIAFYNNNKIENV